MSPTSQSTQNLDDQLALEAEQVTHSLPDLRQRWLDSQGAHNPSRNDIAFSYAVLLIKSSNKKDNKLGMSILMDLIDVSSSCLKCSMFLLPQFYQDLPPPPAGFHFSSSTTWRTACIVGPLDFID
jgi:hypothetical protein